MFRHASGANLDASARHDNLDLLKSVAIFLMVLFHYNNLDISFWETPSVSTWTNYIASSFFCLCVPILFLVNGALLLNRPFTLKRHVLRTGSLVCLTVFWAVLTLAVLMALNGDTFSPGLFFQDLWYWKEHYTNHLWFLLTLVQIYLFLPVLLSAKEHMPDAYTAFFICVMALVFGNSVLLYLANLVQYMTGLRIIQGNFNFFNQFNPFTGNFGFAMGYFLLGGRLHQMRSRLDTPRARLLAGAVLLTSMLALNGYGVLMSAMNGAHYVLETSCYPSFCFFFAAASVYVLTLRYTARGIFGRIVRCVGSNTLAVLFLHRILAVGLLKLIPGLPFGTGIPANMLFALAVVLVSAGIGAVLRRIPGLRRLFQT